MRSIGVIAARGSSKRLPRKCMLPLGGRPLVQYSCLAATAAKLDRIVITTEDPEIASAAAEVGVNAPFLRPAALAEDWATSPSILQHALDEMETRDGYRYDVAVLLQSTSPFIQPAIIDACVEALRENPNAASAVTVRAVKEPPQWMYSIDGNGYASNILSQKIDAKTEHKQLLNQVFIPTGGAYAIRSDILRQTGMLLVDPMKVVEVDQIYAADIDDAEDFARAEALLPQLDLHWQS